MKKENKNQNYQDQFLKVLRKFSHSHGTYEAFCDWLEISAITIHQAPYNMGMIIKDAIYNKLESQYLDLIKKYKKDEVERFAELFAITQMALNERSQDFLGNVFGLAEFPNRDKGQFFTPYHISQMMAKMTLGDINKLIEEKGYFTICEPCCGAGGMIIAVADEVSSQGFCPHFQMMFFATDIDRKCFNMTYIQTSLLGIAGYVCHGNTLSNEIWEKCPTPNMRLCQKTFKAPETDAADFTNVQLNLL